MIKEKIQAVLLSIFNHCIILIGYIFLKFTFVYFITAIRCLFSKRAVDPLSKCVASGKMLEKV